MKKLLFLLLLFPLVLVGQPTPAGGGVGKIVAGTNITISPTSGQGQAVTINASGGGSSAFNAVTSGTNTTATMTVGTGAAIATSGSGTVAATSAPLSGITGAGANVLSAMGNALNASSGVLGKNSDGTLTLAGSVISAPATITPSAGAGTLTVTNAYSQMTFSAAVTLNFSAAGSSGQRVRLDNINTAAGAVVVTLGTNGSGTITCAGNGSSVITPVLIQSNGTTWTVVGGDPATIVKIATFVIDGAGSPITAGVIPGTSRIVGNYSLYGYSITATAATSTNTVKFWKHATANDIPVVGDNINTSGISLSGGSTAVTNTGLGDFGANTAFSNLDMVRCNVTAVDGTATDLTVTLYGIRL